MRHHNETHKCQAVNSFVFGIHRVWKLCAVGWFAFCVLKDLKKMQIHTE
jgi:hypothetical protein